MIYATLTDLESYVTADWLNELSSTIRTNHLTDASALMDSYIGQRHKLPLTVGNRALVRACCIIARWQLILHVGINTDSHHDTYSQEYVATMKWLEDVAKGRAILDGITDSSTGSPLLPTRGLMVFTGKKARWY